MTVSQSLDSLTLDTETPDEFYLGLVRFDVREAKRILAAKKRKPTLYKCELEPLKKEVQRPDPPKLENGKIVVTAGRMALDWDLIHAPDIDLRVPILLARLPDPLRGIWPIDGWYRIANAIDAGLDCLPCYILSKQDTARIIEWPE
ncbi:hypothetical protein [Aporhodopirellula aestuarii]|uniref:Uncharacterized protein n=1 Tax=Aporhodopirellula aestuarii TaxID=2950107 RepID=A0ABT0UD33_9BACT|nr:hypothetical protein [Aporhodopirellula aestuarii]MCM2374691.1 hypothetical protein [Aporhodopirellula aestuarii]